MKRYAFWTIAAFSIGVTVVTPARDSSACGNALHPYGSSEALLRSAEQHLEEGRLFAAVDRANLMFQDRTYGPHLNRLPKYGVDPLVTRALVIAARAVTRSEGA